MFNEEDDKTVVIIMGSREIVGHLTKENLNFLADGQVFAIRNPMRLQIAMTQQGPQLMPLMPLDVIDATEELVVHSIDGFYFAGKELTGLYSDTAQQIRAAKAGITMSSSLTGL